MVQNSNGHLLFDPGGKMST